ncbi:MAG: hypothetical protein BZY81_01090 [SAR202 cluster bacterium Io17-Chloro-G4]|nr:MAG: hypothetical protein BZY81_01090 [SAR202 cluster bacterium Io17-Chloro-G4]
MAETKEWLEEWVARCRVLPIRAVNWGSHKYSIVHDQFKERRPSLASLSWSLTALIWSTGWTAIPAQGTSCWDGASRIKPVGVRVGTEENLE